MSTVATVGLLVVHDTGWPVSVLPAESLVVATRRTPWPIVSDALAGVTSTEATGAGGADVTVIAALPDFPSLVAVTVAEPAATADTKPALSTVAIAGSLVVQLTARPLSVLPAESWVVAVSCTLPPGASDALAGDTTTDATGAAVGGATRVSTMLSVA